MYKRDASAAMKMSNAPIKRSQRERIKSSSGSHEEKRPDDVVSSMSPGESGLLVPQSAASSNHDVDFACPLRQMAIFNALRRRHFQEQQRASMSSWGQRRLLLAHPTQIYDHNMANSTGTQNYPPRNYQPNPRNQRHFLVDPWASARGRGMEFAETLPLQRSMPCPPIVGGHNDLPSVPPYCRSVQNPSQRHVEVEQADLSLSITACNHDENGRGSRQRKRKYDGFCQGDETSKSPHDNNGPSALKPNERMVPCKRRGMLKEHMSENAFFIISDDTVHGDNLICSFPACRAQGPRFRYCAACRSPVALCNFTTRHNHHPEEFLVGNGAVSAKGDAPLSSKKSVGTKAWALNQVKSAVKNK